MGDDDPFLRYVRRDLREPSRDVLVGQAVKSVAAHTLGIEMFGNGVVIGDRAVLAMKCGVEARHLRQPQPVDHDRPDGSQIMRLMQRRERDVSLKAAQHLLRHKDGLIEFRPAMHDPMPDCDRMDVEFVAKPRARGVQRCWNVGHGFIRVCSLNQNLAFGRSGGQVRLGADAFDFAFELAAEPAGLIDAEDFKFDA